MDKLRLFSTQADYEDEVANLEYPTISYIEGTEEISFTPTYLKYKKKYFTFEALEDGTFTLTIPASINTSYMTSVSYSIDNGDTWITTTVDSTEQTITTPTITQGNMVLWKGVGIRVSGQNVNSRFTSTGRFNVTGNIMSLLYEDNFQNKTIFANTSGYVFKGLFKGAQNLINAKNLILSATTLTQQCYDSMFYNCTGLTTPPIIMGTTLAYASCEYMFYGCTSLTKAPELPATTLSQSCYLRMFSGCTTLKTAPTLPATTLGLWCYDGMFNGCSSLTTPPVLPATTLIKGCYRDMFNGCSSLNVAPTLPATTLTTYCYSNMFQGCTSLTTAPTLPATTLAEECYYYMFSGTNVLPDCSNIDFTSSTIVASGGLRGLFAGTKITDSNLNVLLPKNNNNKLHLPVTTLTTSCYQSMFANCTLLTTAPELPATTLANKCYSNMFSGCTSLTTAPELPATTLTTGCYTRMFKGCTSLTDAPELLGTNPQGGSTVGDISYYEMFMNCTSLINAPSILPATTLTTDCYNSMFRGCTSLTTAPVLPATTLGTRCYYYMFDGCSSLNYIKAMFTTTPGTSYTSNWVNGVAATGTFVKNSAAQWNVTGVNGVPSGWTVQTASE